ncbi:hypothetical protein DCAR_0417395 [Daucus carota subsp. sativus]|uniref:Uncharacterized protein n=1 Tax=Daucus carota subsp. sativus TaxID=79200 RepID=A0A165YEG3_DAUCS|nr:hypothetical protein DCAR_0417395 [Daucus carota subsp. sativus]
MAGLQYKFFPTDFYFPVPKQSSEISTGNQQIFPVIKTEEIHIEKSSETALVHRQIKSSKIVLKALPSSLSLAPVVKKNISKQYEPSQ